MATSKETTKYVLAHNEAEVIHFVIVKTDSVFETGQPIVEEFATLEEAKLRVDELKGIGYFEEHFSKQIIE
jgi:hypothetical protein